MIRINKKCVFLFILLLLSTNLEIFNYAGNHVLELLEEIFRILALASAGFWWVMKRKRTISPIFIMFIIMLIWLLFSTMINHGNFYGFLVTYIPPILFSGFIVENMKDDLVNFIKTSMFLGEVLCYANFLTVLLFPDGLYSTYTNSFLWYSTKNWLLGNRNIFISYLLFFNFIAFLHRCLGGSRLREWGIHIISLFSVLLVKSATSTIGLVVLIAMFFLIKTEKIKFHVYMLATINVLMFFGIVVFRIQYMFSFIIEDLLGKSLSFSGRTLLWDSVERLIVAQPIYGYGVPKPGFFQYLLGISFAGHAHNLILNYLCRGGMVYLGMYLFLLYLIYHQLFKAQNRVEYQCTIAVLFVLQIMGLSEPFENNAYVYMIYFLAYHIRFLLIKPSLQKQVYSPKGECMKADLQSEIPVKK